MCSLSPSWKLAQYNLSIPIPNDLVKEFKERIETYEKKRSTGKDR